MLADIWRCSFSFSTRLRIKAERPLRSSSSAFEMTALVISGSMWNQGVSTREASSAGFRGTTELVESACTELVECGSAELVEVGSTELVEVLSWSSPVVFIGRTFSGSEGLAGCGSGASGIKNLEFLLVFRFLRPKT
jgi:hypothetical protein